MKLNKLLFAMAPLLFVNNAGAFTTELTGSYGSQPQVNKEGLSQLRGSTAGRNYAVATDIYANKGDELNVEVSGSSNVVLCVDVLTDPGVCSSKIALTEGINTVTSPIKGEVYIGNKLTTNETATVTVTGGQYMPIFTLNEDTDAEFLSMIDESNSYENIHLVSDNVVITGPIKKYRDYGINNPTELLELWEDILEAGQYQYGINSNLVGSIHESIHSKLQWMDVGEKGAGLMYAGGNHLGTGTDSAFKLVVDTDDLSGQSSPNAGWGPWHEYGHSMQPRKVVTFDGMGEVTVNLTSLYIQTELLGLPSRIADRWEPTILPYLEKDDAGKDFFTDDGVEPLGFFWQFHLIFGDRFYKRLMAEYRQENVEHLETTGEYISMTSNEQVQSLLLKASDITGYDLRPFFRKWGLPIDQSTEDQFTVNWRLKDAGNIWENTDLDQPYTHLNFGDDVAVTYNDTDNNVYVDYDFYRTDKSDYSVVLHVRNTSSTYINGKTYNLHKSLSPEYARQTLRKPVGELEIGEVVRVDFEDSNGLTHSFTYTHTGTDIAYDGKLLTVSLPDAQLEGLSKVVVLIDNHYAATYSPDGTCYYCQASSVGEEVKLTRGIDGYDVDENTMVKIIYEYEEKEDFVYNSYLDR